MKLAVIIADFLLGVVNILFFGVLYVWINTHPDKAGAVWQWMWH